jgi:hypothetical protein
MGSKTAVQWLQEKLFELEINIDSKTHEEAFFIFEEAKQMEKEQIMDSYEYGNCDWEFGIYIKGEQYYNETYGN